MAHKLVEDNEKSFKVQRPDGKVIHIAKTPETMPIYKLCTGGMTQNYDDGGIVGEAAKLAPLAMEVAPLLLNEGGKLDANARDHIKSKNFAEPGERKYPIEDKNHARNALARVSQNGTPEEKAKVRAAVHAKYPEMASEGGKVPGKAKVAGDSPTNDVVPAKLSPGEIVIPRTVVAGGPQAVMKFVQDALAGKHPASPGPDHYNGGLSDIGSALTNILPQGSPLQEAMSGQTDWEGNPQAVGDTSGQMQVQGAPLQNAQQDFDNSGYDPGSAPQQPAQPPVPVANVAQASLPNAGGTASDVAPQQIPLADAANAPDKVDANVGAPDGTGHVTPGSGNTGGTFTGGPMIGPNGYIMSQSQTTSDKSMTPEQREAYNDKVDADNQNLQAQQDADTAKYKLQAQQLQQEADITKTNNDKFAALEQQKNEEIQRQLTNIKNIGDKFAGMSIDSHRMFGDGITGSKIMAGIGLALGAFGQAGGGSNQAMDAINKAIDRDVDIQKANINKVGKEYEMARGGLQDYLNTTKDMEASLTAEKARQLDLVSKQFQQIAAANPNPMIKAAATQRAADVAQQHMQLLGQLESHTTSKVQSATMPHYEAQVPGDNDKVNNNIAVQAQTEKLMDLANSFTGPIKGSMEMLKNRFGLQSADEKTFTQNVQAITDKIIHNIAGSRGMAPQEMSKLQQLGLNMRDNPEAFIAALKNIHDQAGQENATIAQANAENRRYPIDLNARRKAYDLASPTGMANHLGATPMLGLNKKHK